MMRSTNEVDGTRILFTGISGLMFLGLAAVSAMVAVISLGLLTPTQLASEWAVSRDILRMLGELSWVERLGLAGGASVIGIGSAVAFLYAVTPKRRGAAFHMLSVDDQGIVAIDTRGIATIAVEAAMNVRGVVDAEVSVRGRATTPVRLKVDIAVFPGTMIKDVGIDVRALVRSAVEELVGVQVGDVTVKAHVLDGGALSRMMG